MLADCPLKTFLDSAQSLSPSERGELLLESEDLMEAHTQAASEGESNQVAERRTPIGQNPSRYCALIGLDHEADASPLIPIPIPST